MAINTKAIKNRIKSVRNTKKITKAMEMVSAAKMRKAVEATLRARMYAELTHDLLKHLAQIKTKNTPFFEKREVKRILVILISSNRGLCGSFNSNLFKKTLALLQDTNNVAEDIHIDILGIGKKSATFAKKNNYPLVAVFDELGERPEFEEMLPISTMAANAFNSREYDKVMIAFTEYRTSMLQIAKMRQLLPISELDIEKMLGHFSTTIEKEIDDPDTYLFEPNQEMIMEVIVPRLVEVQLYQALLESSASEHSARMVAMKQASDAAGDMIDELVLQFNKGRQAAITQEIAEIAGGAATLG